MLDIDFSTAFSGHDSALLAKASVKESSLYSSLSDGVMVKKAEAAEDPSRSGGLFGNLKSSLAKDQAAKEDSPMCFPGEATVWVKNVGERKMENLQIGDIVLTSSGFNEVVGFLHREPFEAPFLRINTNFGMLTISRDHIVFVQDACTRRTNLPAACLRPGVHNILRLHADGNFIAIPITDISATRSEGFYAPLTTSGDIVVDGFLCSCYATPTNWELTNTHAISDLIMSPLKTANNDVLSAYAQRLLWFADAILATN